MEISEDIFEQVTAKAVAPPRVGGRLVGRTKSARNWYVPSPDPIYDREGNRVTGLSSNGGGYGFARQVQDKVLMDRTEELGTEFHEADPDYGIIRKKGGRDTVVTKVPAFDPQREPVKGVYGSGSHRYAGCQFKASVRQVSEATYTHQLRPDW